MEKVRLIIHSKGLFGKHDWMWLGRDAERIPISFFRKKFGSCKIRNHTL